MKKQKIFFGKNKNTENQGSRRGIPMKTVTMIEVGGAVVLIALLLLLYVLYTDKLSSLKPESPTYQYTNAYKIEYSGNANFRNQDGVRVADSLNNGDVINTPLINDEKKSLTLTCNMLLMIPGEGTGLCRVNTFTEVTSTSGLVTYMRNDKKAQSYGGFLHDGEDVYIFLDPTVLTIGNVSYELEPLSYAKVWYNQKIEFYNSLTGEDKVIALVETDAIAECSSDFANYKLDLGKDVIIINGEEALLFSSVEEVNPMKMSK